MGREIQSVEISFFAHATEDETRLVERVSSFFSLPTPKIEVLEGHFGNRIARVIYHVTGQEATALFSLIASKLSKDDARKILDDRVKNVDEHGALYLRLSKQELMSKRLVLVENEAVRVKVKPKGKPREDTTFQNFLMAGRSSD
jgi:RNA binding exosome subunit